ncbi:MAG: DUF3618 domain-containing protein [Pseudohongiella sp.]|nr:DUF3618 domain-containing protein [Pseudohongiella sp.]
MSTSVDPNYNEFRGDLGNHDSKNDSKNDEHKSPEQLEREVELARARLTRTASELSHRLSPGELIDQALDMAREHGGEFGRNLGAQVKSNPLPMILTGIGISWLMMSSGRTGASAAHTRAKAAELGHNMHDATDHMKESVHDIRENLTKFYRDEPLLAGSLGVAIGAALGALVPPTEFEDETFGKARDHSLEAAKSAAVKNFDGARDSTQSQ